MPYQVALTTVNSRAAVTLRDEKDAKLVFDKAKKIVKLLSLPATATIVVASPIKPITHNNTHQAILSLLNRV